MCGRWGTGCRPLGIRSEMLKARISQRCAILGMGRRENANKQYRIGGARWISGADPWPFPKGATSSWKQVQFGEANSQLTFDEGDEREIDGVDCVKIEPDMDYYKDLGAHFLLEVVVRGASHTLTKPKQVYVLRCIAGDRA
jgi:hypothetical protein